MDISKSLDKSLAMIYNLNYKGGFSFRAMIPIGVCCIITLNILCFMIDRWDDVSDRIDGVKGITIIVLIIVYSQSLTFYWSEFERMFMSLHDMIHKVPYATSAERQNVITSVVNDMKVVDKIWHRMIVSYGLSMTILPFLTVLVRITIFSEDFQKITKETLSKPLPLYYPKLFDYFENYKSLTNVSIYVAGYILHSMYVTYAALYAYLLNSNSLTAMKILELDLKMLAISFKEIIVDTSNEFNSRDYEKNGPDSNVRLKKFFIYAVEHHQSIYMKSQTVSIGIRWLGAVHSITASIYMCTSIYGIVQNEEIILKIREVVFLSVWVLCVFLYSLYGERIQAEDENLRRAIYECSWINKPEWFKKSLLIMMTRSTKTITMQPFGIFAMNLRSFATIMNTAYSYYNLLHKLKKE